MPDLIPHISQYTGVWSIEPLAAERFTQMVCGIDWPAHFRDVKSRIDAGENVIATGGYELTPEGVAIVDLEGVLTKYGSSLSSSGSTVCFRSTLRSVRQAHETGQVKAAIIVIESPGGSTMGTPEAAAEVAALAEVMPVWAYIEDIGASAAYWIASQASRVIANASAMVGSIGTYFAIDDVSGAFTKAGIKTHLFTTGPQKAAGYVGTELTEAQAAEFQSLVERMNKPFVAAVAEARGLSGDALAAVTDGRVWRGDEAVALGLIDAVMSYDDALAELAAQSTNQSTNGARAMPKPRATSASSQTPKSEEPDKTTDAEVVVTDDEENKDQTTPEPGAAAKPDNGTEQPASLADLKAALPKASADFILSALEGGMSVTTARMTWMEQKIASQEKQIEKLQATGPKPGADPLPEGSKPSFTGDAKAAWEAAIKAKCDAGMSRQAATSAVVKDQPELHQAFLAACNTK